ncbi:uncharacterized protein LOC135940687 [Cloeon dipterum]|uniref:uncharacterized protein LOC135940687 n=1 Tax=Cloeon dipterum TaxID=197152 RepID=UPI00321F76AF
MKVASVVLVIAGFAQNTQCFFPLFFPGPIIYPKTTTEAPKPTEPPPPPPKKTIIHHYVPQKHHYHYYQPHYVSYHHSDESNSVEEYTEEVTEPTTTPKPTTTTTTTPEPTTKKHHYYRLVYPKPPPIYHPLAYLKHHFGGYNHPPPVHYLPPFHPHEYPAARHQVETFVPEPDEFDGEGYPVEKPTEPPPPPPPPPPTTTPVPTTTAAPEPTTKKHRYHTYVRPKHPPSYSRYHGGYEGPRVRYYPASYPKRPVEPPTPPQSGESDSDASPPSMKSPSPPPTPIGTEEPFHEPVYKSRLNQRRPPSPGQPYPDQFQNPMLQRPSEPSEPPVYRLNKSPGRTPAPPPALFAPDVVVSTPAVVPEVSTPTSVDVEVEKSVQLPVSSVKNLAPPVRVDGSKYEYWNRRDSTQNPNLESDFDSASFNLIREMIANSTRTPS